MRRLTPFVAVAIVLAAVLALTGCSGSPSGGAATSQPVAGSSAGASGTQVTIANFAYAPAEVTVKVGDTVTWTNNDTVAHTVTGDGFDSGAIPQGGQYSYTFAKAGTFPYRCTFHPSMAPGKVTVQ